MTTTNTISEAAYQEGFTLPRRWYVDPVVLGLENDLIFRPSWQYAGSADAVADPGSYFSCVVGRTPVVVLRDDSGTLRAFANVCQHRGMILVEGAGSCRLLQCPYHGWTYALDGSVNRAPGFDNNPRFDPRAHHLTEYRVDTWGPLIFVSRDLNIGGISEYLAPLETLLDEVNLSLASLRFYRRYEYPMRANWKVAIENSLECYHCAVAHPELKAITDLQRFAVTNYKNISSQTAPTRPGDEVANYEATTGEIERGVWTHIWPNSEISVNPGPQNLSARAFLPLAHDRTVAVYDQYLLEGYESDDAKVGEFADLVARQDIALCEGVQRGLESGGFDTGPLNLGGLPDEIGLQWWEQRYIAAMQ
jgi:choline monooxygenase